MQYDSQFKFKIIAPTPSLKSPDISAPVGNSCTRPKKGDSRFFSKQRPNFLDVNIDGENEGVSAQELKIRLLQSRSKTVAANSLKKQTASFKVTIKNGKIIKMTNENNQKVSYKGYNLNMLGLAGEGNGTYEV